MVRMGRYKMTKGDRRDRHIMKFFYQLRSHPQHGVKPGSKPRGQYAKYHQRRRHGVDMGGYRGLPGSGPLPGYRGMRARDPPSVGYRGMRASGAPSVGFRGFRARVKAARRIRGGFPPSGGGS